MLNWLALGLIAGAALIPQKAKRDTPPPIVTVPMSRPIIHERYGAWEVSQLGAGWAAYTTNDSGSTFGVLCKTGCVTYTNARTSCKDGESYPALVNSPAGAFHIMLQCAIVSGHYLFISDLSKTVVDALEIGGEYGLAFPLESGRFQVARFSLTGGLKAASRALELSEAGKPASQERKSLDDYRL